MAFNFRLQNVLDYRRGLADRMKADVAITERQLRDEEARLAQLYADHEQTLARLATPDDFSVDIGQIEHATIHLDTIEHGIATQRAQLERARATYEQARAALIALEKDAKTLEKLRERQAHEYTAESNRKEQADASEITATFHRRFQDASA